MPTGKYRSVIFFLNGLNGTEKVNLLNKCLEFINESGVVVSSFTFDGTPTNLAMATNLGASFKVTSFPNPRSQENIFFYLDACHMLKLIRNCLASQGKLTDGDGNEILWIFFENLVNLQNIEGLHATTKLRKRHLEWAREKNESKNCSIDV
jgi:hypothetical protein